MAAPEDRLGQPLLAYLFDGDEEWRLQRAFGESRLELNQPVVPALNPDGSPAGFNLPPGQLRIPAGFPGAGGPAPNNDMRPYMTPLGMYLASLYPASNYTDPNNLYNYAYSALEPENREELKLRFDWNVNNNTKAFVRVSRDPADTVRPRGGWWAPSDVALPSPNIEKSLGRSYSGNLVSVLSPSMTNEAVVSYTRLTLDNFWQDPSVVAQGAGGVTFTGFSGFPYPTGPELPTNIIHDGGRWAISGPPCRTCSRTTTRYSSATS